MQTYIIASLSILFIVYVIWNDYKQEKKRSDKYKY